MSNQPTQIHHHHHYAPGQVAPGEGGGLGQQGAVAGGVGQQGFQSGQQGFQAGQQGLQGGQAGYPPQDIGAQGVQGTHGQQQGVGAPGFQQSHQGDGLTGAYAPPVGTQQGHHGHHGHHTGAGQPGLAAAAGDPYGTQSQSRGLNNNQTTAGAGGLHSGQHGHHNGNHHPGAEAAAGTAVAGTALHEEHKHGHGSHNNHNTGATGTGGLNSTTGQHGHHTGKHHHGAEGAAGAAAAGTALHEERKHEHNKHSTAGPGAGIGSGTGTGTATGSHGNAFHESPSSRVGAAGNTTSSNLTGTSTTGASGQTIKPTLGDKIGGSIEKVVGKLTKDPELVQEGIARKEGLPVTSAGSGVTHSTTEGPGAHAGHPLHGKETGVHTKDYGVTGSGQNIGPGVQGSSYSV